MRILSLTLKRKVETVRTIYLTEYTLSSAPSPKATSPSPPPPEASLPATSSPGLISSLIQFTVVAVFLLRDFWDVVEATEAALIAIEIQRNDFRVDYLVEGFKQLLIPVVIVAETHRHWWSPACNPSVCWMLNTLAIATEHPAYSFGDSDCSIETAVVTHEAYVAPLLHILPYTIDDGHDSFVTLTAVDRDYIWVTCLVSSPGQLAETASLNA